MGFCNAPIGCWCHGAEKGQVITLDVLAVMCMSLRHQLLRRWLIADQITRNILVSAAPCSFCNLFPVILRFAPAEGNCSFVFSGIVLRCAVLMMGSHGQHHILIK